MACMAGGEDLLTTLESDAALMKNPSAKAGIEEMSSLFTYLRSYKIVDKVCALFSAVRSTMTDKIRSRLICRWLVGLITTRVSSTKPS